MECNMVLLSKVACSCTLGSAYAASASAHALPQS